jgi:integrase/recombinase XerD
MTSWLADRWPVLARHERAAEWLQVWADLGRAPGTVEAYARGLAEYLQVCERDGMLAATLSAHRLAAFDVHVLAGRCW